MAKYANDAGLDAALAWYADCDELNVCSAQPTTYTEAITTYSLADVAVTPGAGNGDFTIANGDTSGRKLTVAAQTAIPVDTTGTATHIALTKSWDTTLRYVTTCTSQGLTSGNTVNTPAFDFELGDPT
jgi:hypothetical protein